MHLTNCETLNRQGRQGRQGRKEKREGRREKDRRDDAGGERRKDGLNHRGHRDGRKKRILRAAAAAFSMTHVKAPPFVCHAEPQRRIRNPSLVSRPSSSSLRPLRRPLRPLRLNSVLFLASLAAPWRLGGKSFPSRRHAGGCNNWIRFPKVSSKIATVPYSSFVGSCRNSTPRPFSRSYSAWMSSVLKTMIGMFAS
jgi:hypothetical protein